jgi:predicted transcriptional regulator
LSERESLRTEIEKVISEHPGIHFREIQRRSGSAVGQLEYHLYQLEKMDKISIKKDGKLKRYFLIEDTGYNERRLLFFLRNNLSRDVLYHLMENEYAPMDLFLTGRRSRREKTKEIVDEMAEQGILHIQTEQKRVILFLNDSDKVKETLSRFRESFLDTMSSNILSLLD